MWVENKEASRNGRLRNNELIWSEGEHLLTLLTHIFILTQTIRNFRVVSRCLWGGWARGRTLCQPACLPASSQPWSRQTRRAHRSTQTNPHLVWSRFYCFFFLHLLFLFNEEKGNHELVLTATTWYNTSYTHIHTHTTHKQRPLSTPLSLHTRAFSRRRLSAWRLSSRSRMRPVLMAQRMEVMSAALSIHPSTLTPTHDSLVFVRCFKNIKFLYYFCHVAGDDVCYFEMFLVDFNCCCSSRFFLTVCLWIGFDLIIFTNVSLFCTFVNNNKFVIFQLYSSLIIFFRNIRANLPTFSQRKYTDNKKYVNKFLPNSSWGVDQLYYFPLISSSLHIGIARSHSLTQKKKKKKN